MSFFLVVGQRIHLIATDIQVKGLNLFIDVNVWTVRSIIYDASCKPSIGHITVKLDTVVLA
jgi:hypothetical protein